MIENQEKISKLNKFLNEVVGTENIKYLSLGKPENYLYNDFNDIFPLGNNNSLLFNYEYCYKEEEKNKGINTEHFVLKIDDKKFHIKKEIIENANIEMMYVNELLLEMQEKGYDTFGIKPLVFFDKNGKKKSAMATEIINKKQIIITQHQKDYKKEKGIVVRYNGQQQTTEVDLELLTKINQIAYFFMPITGDLKPDNVIVDKDNNIIPIDVSDVSLAIRIMYSDKSDANNKISQEAAKRSILMMKNLPENFIEEFNKKFFKDYNLENMKFMKKFIRMQDRESWIKAMENRLENERNEYEETLNNLFSKKVMLENKINPFDPNHANNVIKYHESTVRRRENNIENDVAKRTSEFLQILNEKTQNNIIYALNEEDKIKKEKQLENKKIHKAYTIIINKTKAELQDKKIIENITENEKIKIQKKVEEAKRSMSKKKEEEKRPSSLQKFKKSVTGFFKSENSEKNIKQETLEETKELFNLPKIQDKRKTRWF